MSKIKQKISAIESFDFQIRCSATHFAIIDLAKNNQTILRGTIKELEESLDDMIENVIGLIDVDSIDEFVDTYKTL